MHILNRHGGDFAGRGIPTEDIPDLVINAATKGKLVGSRKSGENVRDVYEVVYRGRNERVVVGISDNGYIVTAYPN